MRSRRRAFPPRAAGALLAASVLLLVVAATLSITGDSLALTDGPDGGGYSYIDSAEPGGPNFPVKEISSSGAKIASGCDNCLTSAPIGFAFSYYGSQFTSATVSANGSLQFNSPNVTSQCGDVPANPLGAAILPMCVNLTMKCEPGAPAAIYSQTEGAPGNRTFTVEWYRNSIYPAGLGSTCFGTGDVTFQVVLFEATGEVLIAYQDTFFRDDSGNNNGAQAVIGIQANSTTGLRYSAPTADGLQICFRPAGANPTSVCAGGPVVPTPSPSPSPSPSASATASATPAATPGSGTPTPSPTATVSPTPTATATPVPTPTGTPPAVLTQGDGDCDGDVDAIDGLKTLRYVAGLPGIQTEPCPDVGGPAAAAASGLFGDVDCDGDVDAVDGLLILRHVAGLTVAQLDPCPDIGEPLG